MNTVDATDARLTTHEEVCALRYEKINESLEVGDKRMTFVCCHGCCPSRAGCWS
jgi:hypothetical protein